MLNSITELNSKHVVIALIQLLLDTWSPVQVIMLAWVSTNCIYLHICA
jgi:hypothetical protein